MTFDFSLFSKKIAVVLSVSLNGKIRQNKPSICNLKTRGGGGGGGGGRGGERG